MIPKPLEVKAINSDSIALIYDDGTSGIVNLSELIEEPYFADLQNSEFFNKVYITKNSAAIAWNEDLELCANSLYLEIKGLTFEQWETDGMQTSIQRHKTVGISYLKKQIEHPQGS